MCYFKTLLLFLLSISGSSIAHKKNTLTITIFIHGTHHIATWAIPQQIPLLYDFVHCKKGLNQLSDTPKNNFHQWCLYNLTRYNDALVNPEHTYLFYWSGKLSRTERLEEAKNLHKELTKLAQQHPNKKLHIQLVTHSHGGNVALNLAKIEGKKRYTIDRLILLAVPVQKETKSYVENSLFKEVYSFYSWFDITQIVDPQGIYPLKDHLKKVIQQKKYIPYKQKQSPFFSERRFDSPKVKHIEVRNAGRPIMHIEYLFPTFMKNLSSALLKAQHHDFSKEDLIINYPLKSKL